jgi:SAM-dependent methyltransferase
MHGTDAPSDWIQRFGALVPPGAAVLDVASGAGRHSRWFAARGARVTAIDRDAQALEGLDSVARVVQADIETGPWPLPGEGFDAVVITHYLWRPLWPVLLRSLKPGGWLLVETFAWGHERLGRPRNPDFLLRPGELLEVAQAQARLAGLADGLHILAYEDGLLGQDTSLRRVQRLAACRPANPDPAFCGDWPLNPG